MKIAVIGANGNLGSRVTKQALDRGFQVKAFVFHGECLEPRAEVIEKNLFDLKREDLSGIDVLISAFGGGFHADPSINKQAYLKYIELLHDSNIRLISIAGAGSLYTDSTHLLFEYQSPNHPEKLREISKNIRLGVDEIKKDISFDWVVICPSREFDLQGPMTGKYIVGEQEEVIFNDENKSLVTYEDLAKAMVDIAQISKYNHQVITIATKTLK